MHQFFRNRYFMEFNREGRQLSHCLEDFNKSFVTLFPSRSFNSIYWISTSARDYTVLFSEGKPSLKKIHVLQIKDLILWLLIYYISVFCSLWDEVKTCFIKLGSIKWPPFYTCEVFRFCWWNERTSIKHWGENGFQMLGKHRKHPGGRGNAGGMHHHRINFDKYPRILWKSWYEALPLKEEPELLPNCQPW